MYYINRFRPIIEAIANLSVSTVLVKFTNFVLNGVFLDTLASFLCTRIWIDADALYKYWFKENFFSYIKAHFYRCCQNVSQYLVYRKTELMAYIKNLIVRKLKLA